MSTTETIAPTEANFFRASAEDFKKIPGSPVAYWVSTKISDIFHTHNRLESLAPVKVGLQTGSNEKFVREWFEVALPKTSICTEGEHDYTKKWFPYNKGGEYRKWYGNNENIVNWEDDGYEIRNFTDNKGKIKSRPQNRDFYFRDSISWSFVSSSYFGVRFSDTKAIFDVGGSSAFPDQKNRYFLMGLLCSKISHIFMKTMNPTLNFQVGNVASIPIANIKNDNLNNGPSEYLIKAHKRDWNDYETSWDFSDFPLLRTNNPWPLSEDRNGDKSPLPNFGLEGGIKADTLAASYANWRAFSKAMTEEMQRLEEENNRIFIDAYGLQDELTPEVPLNEITLTCNPAYRYGGKATPEELETRLQADTMAEFLSYGVGCMFGRYSLDKPGLILANAGDTLSDFVARVGVGRLEIEDGGGINKLKSESGAQASEPQEPDLFTQASTLSPPTSDISFLPDDDNVIPVLDGDWFDDDVSERFRKFLRVSYGDAHFRENLIYLEESLGKDLRKYFTKDFYKDHVQRYKKRPIYWMFASPKGGFQALIYMHRYNRDTVNTLLNRYLRPYLGKLEDRIRALDHEQVAATSASAQSAARKEQDKLRKTLKECQEWEHDVIFPLAQQRIEIDLDDGVKVNYPKFGKALAKVAGLS